MNLSPLYSFAISMQKELPDWKKEKMGETSVDQVTGLVSKVTAQDAQKIHNLIELKIFGITLFGYIESIVRFALACIALIPSIFQIAIQGKKLNHTYSVHYATAAVMTLVAALINTPQLLTYPSLQKLYNPIGGDVI